MLINLFVILNLSRIFFVYQKSLKLTFKTGFWVQNNLLNCVLVLWIHKGYCVVKKLVWNVRIKAFWYTKLVSTNVYFYFVSFQKFWIIWRTQILATFKDALDSITYPILQRWNRKVWLLITIFATFISFSLPLFLGGKRKGEWSRKIVIKSHTFLFHLLQIFIEFQLKKKIYPQRSRLVICLTLSLSSISYDYLIV